MFDGLTGRLGDIFDKLRRRGSLSEEEVSAALREVRIALLEADVALPVVKDFVGRVRERAVGQEVLRSVTPGQQVIKIVHDAMVEMLGGTPGEEPTPPGAIDIDVDRTPPVPVLMVGLQGSGKTTTTAKIAHRLSTRRRKKVLMASLDTRRPAAMDQLRILGEQAGVATLPIVPGQPPVEIAKRAMQTARSEGYDVVLLDTAGRLAIDDELMAEVAAVRDATRPAETLLVADAMTGQDAVTVATNFEERVGVTGIVLTRVDGDARGGAALSMRAITGKPIKLIGVGEKIDALEAFHAERIAGRILGMGDVVSLVEKAAETIDQEDAEKLAKKIQKGQFDAGRPLRPAQADAQDGRHEGADVDDARHRQAEGPAEVRQSRPTKLLKRQEAIISSMTPEERRNPKILHAKRKKRVAAGSGTSVQDVNKLLKQYEKMAEMMKKMNKMGKKGQLSPDMLPPELGGTGQPGAGGGLPGLGGPGIPSMPGGAGARLPARTVSAGSGDPPSAPDLKLDRQLTDLRKKDVHRHSSLPRRRQEAAVLFDRGRRQAHATRRPLHREDRLLQPDAAARARAPGGDQDRAGRSTGWANGATPSDRVAKFFAEAGLMEARGYRETPKKSSPKAQGAGAPARCSARPRKQPRPRPPKRKPRRPRRRSRPREAPAEGSSGCGDSGRGDARRGREGLGPGFRRCRRPPAPTP